MHRAWVRVLFAICSFVPTVGVFALAAWFALVIEKIDPSRTSTSDFEDFLVVLVGAVVIAFWQIAMGIVVAVHTSGRKDLSSGAKAGWTLGCLFCGSMVLPLFTFIVLPGAARAAQAAMPGPAPHPGQGPMPMGRY